MRISFVAELESSPVNSGSAEMSSLCTTSGKFLTAARLASTRASAQLRTIEGKSDAQKLAEASVIRERACRRSLWERTRVSVKQGEEQRGE